MSEDGRSPFGLGKLREGIARRRASLSHDTNPQTKSIDSQFADKLFTFEQEDYDRTEAPRDDMRKYWRQFETTPIVRKPITSYASRVVEPGYYFELPDELGETQQRKVRRKLNHFAETCAIVEGEINQDLSTLIKKKIIQKEVRGTTLTEKVPDANDDDVLAGLKLINAETMEVVTRPNQTMLLAPEDSQRNDWEDVPKTDDGQAAAYLQDIYETRNTLFNYDVVTNDGTNKIPFTRDEIIKITRDADVGEVFGTSRIEAVSDRVSGIKQKLSDHDEAIASKAYPLWLFMFGDPETTGVWDRDDIDNFMSAHEMDNFHPGMKQGVRGDVSVEPISGEVADIAESLEFDVNWIMSAMPMPKYSLGGFGESVGQIAGVAQQSDVQRQIREERRELSKNFSPVFQKKAQEFGVREEFARDIKLKFGDPEKPEQDINSNEQIVRYIGKDGGGVNAVRDKNDTIADTPDRDTGGSGSGDIDIEIGGEDVDGSSDDSSSGEGDGSGGEDESTTSQSEDLYDPRESEQSVWSADATMQLAHHDETKHEAELSVTVSNVVTNVRDDILDSMDSDTDIERAADRAIQRNLKDSDFQEASHKAVEMSMDEAAKLVEGEAHLSRHSDASMYKQNIRNAVEDFAEEMARRIRVQTRHGMATGEDIGDIKHRVWNEFSDADIANRAKLIARMECREARESAKLRLFEQADDIVGIKFPEGSHSHDVCAALSGTHHHFDDGLRESMRLAVGDASSQSSFDPLPITPPMHYGCTMSMEPLYEVDAETVEVEKDG